MPRKSKAKKCASEAQDQSSSDQGSNAEEQPPTWACMPYLFSPPNRTQCRTQGGGESSTPYMTFQPAPREKKETKTVTVVWKLSTAIDEKILCSVKESDSTDSTDSTSSEQFLYNFIVSAPDCYFTELLSLGGGSSRSKVFIDLSLGCSQCIRIANTNEDIHTEDAKHFIYRIGLESKLGMMQPSDSLYDLIPSRHEEVAIVKIDAGTPWGIVGTKGHDTIQTRLIHPTSKTTEKATKKAIEKSPTKATRTTAAASTKKAVAKKASSPKANLNPPPGSKNKEAKDSKKASGEQAEKVPTVKKTTPTNGCEMGKEKEAGLKDGEKTKTLSEKTSANGKKRKAADTEAFEGETVKRNKRAKKDPNAPKRPISAFFYFSKEMRPKVAAENPEAKSTEITKMLGAMWRELDGDDKKKYDKKAKADHDRYASAKETYDAKVAKEAEEGNADSDDDAEPMETNETDDEEVEDSSVGGSTKKGAGTEVIVKKKAKRAKKDPNAPKRPISAFFYFSKEMRPKVAAENPEAKSTEITKMLGAMWRELDGDGKKKYDRKAKADHDRYASAKETYDAKVAKEAEEGNADSDDDAEPMETNETDDEEVEDSSVGGSTKKGAGTEVIVKKKAKRAKKDPNAPKRPISAFFYFSKEMRPKVAAENPEAKSTEITKMLGAMWRELDGDGKKKYDRKAKADHDRYASAKETYDAKVAKEAEEGNADSDDDAEPMETNETDDEEVEDSSVGGSTKKGAGTEVIVKKKAKRAKKDPNAPKRPISAFFYFSKEMRPKVAAENPEAKSTEITKMLGAMWRELDGDGKKKYDRKAKADHDRYASAKETYDAKVAKEAEEGNADSDDDAEPMETNETDDEEVEDSSVGGSTKKGAGTEVIVKKKAKRAKKDPNAPKRPISAFFYFSKEMRPKVAAENPEAKSTEITKMLGAMWRELDGDGKKKYDRKAKADHDRYASAKETYDAKVAKEAEEGNADSDDDAEPMETNETDDEEVEDSSVGGSTKKGAGTEVIVKKKAKRAKKDPNAPKRPISAFFYFSKEMRPKVAAENPEAKSTEITKMLGAMWRELDGDGKKKYDRKAKADHDRYASAKEAYDANVTKSSSKVRVKKNAATKRASEYKPEQDLVDSMDFDAEPVDTKKTDDGETPSSSKKGKKGSKKKVKKRRRSKTTDTSNNEE
ncbi:unnamed protein product [Cylindrotheca closterium]|uniref:HMG box domain-containing protein n=1 Tax=Cylindrotheca closterium TaxID=2856 RepID=A0AAD2FLF2_9STRA|nr:unnamed protein product [Cylindrotheca closterium]